MDAEQNHNNISERNIKFNIVSNCLFM